MEPLREPAQFAGAHEVADCGLAGIAASQSPDLVALHKNLSPLPFASAKGVLVRLADSWTGSAEMEILVTSLRKLGYAALLAASILNYAPNLAAAEEPARGHFTLTHEVRWQNTSVPAGDYEFAYDPDSVSPVLTITKVSGPRASFMLMVPAREDSKSMDSNRILLEGGAEGSYVSALQLPECGVTLRFDAPRATVKQMAKATTAGGVSGQ